MSVPIQNRATQNQATLTALVGCTVLLLGIASGGCNDPRASLAKTHVTCQIGVENTSKGKKDVFRCELHNISKNKVDSCVRVTISVDSEPRYTSEILCSGPLKPDSDDDGVSDAKDLCPKTQPSSKGSIRSLTEGDPPHKGCGESKRTALSLCGDETSVGRCLVEVFQKSRGTRRAIKRSCIKGGEFLDRCSVQVEEIPR